MSIATNTNEAPAIVEDHGLWSTIRAKALPLSLLICGVLLCLSAFAIPGSKHVQSTVVASSKPFSIEEVQLGWRVVGKNPLGKETWDAEPDKATWKKVVLHLQSEAGALIEIEFLRPNAWFEKWRAEVGQTIDLALSEPGKSGVAEVVRVDACPEIKAGKGPVVTGLYRHLCEAGELVRVEVDADVEPIVSTYNHRFWSATRQNFIQAADLQPGEQLTCTDETLVSVKQVTAVAGAKPVFNLETHNHHVYAVGINGMLVHNMHGDQQLFKIREGARRSKAADLLKQKTIRARIVRKGKPDELADVPVESLRAPNIKSEIPIDRRFGNTVDRTKLSPVDDRSAIVVEEISEEILGLIPVKVIKLVPPKPFNPNPNN